MMKRDQAYTRHMALIYKKAKHDNAECRNAHDYNMKTKRCHYLAKHEPTLPSMGRVETKGSCKSVVVVTSGYHTLPSLRLIPVRRPL